MRLARAAAAGSRAVVEEATRVTIVASASALEVVAVQAGAVSGSSLGLTGFTRLTRLAGLTRSTFLALAWSALSRGILGLRLDRQVVAVAALITVLASVLVAELEADLSLLATASEGLLAVVEEAAVGTV